MNLSLMDGMPVTPLGPEASAMDFSGSTELGIYHVETTQRHAYGRRLITWDGRVYKYCLALDAVVSYHGAGQSADALMTYESVGSNQSIGDTELLIDVTGITKNQLVGGYAAIYNASDVMQWRGIIGNEATSGTTTKIYLDAPLHAAITTAASSIEVFENPYRYCTHVANEYTSTICVPAAGAGAGYNFWGQTWGPCIVSPGEDIDDPAAAKRNLVWGGNYALFTDASKPEGQHAGFYLNQGSSGIAGPAIMLQISI